MRQRKVAHAQEKILREGWTLSILIMEIVSGNHRTQDNRGDVTVGGDSGTRDSSR